jgi:maltooligosyltrehalose trehalohydrolase
VAAWRLVTFAQDHDQIGNRAAGDRLSASLSPDRLAVAAVLTLTAPGTPMLFMGEEWGASTPWQFFTSHPEPDLGRATAEGRIAELARMGWDPHEVPDPQNPATFERSRLNWNELETPEHARLLGLYRDLAALRRERPELTDPDSARTSVVQHSPGDAPQSRVYRIDRGSLSVLINLSPEPAEFEVGTADVVLLATKEPASVAGILTLPSDSAAVVAERTLDGFSPRS